MLPYADELFLTEIDAEAADADVFFPEFNTNEWNREIIGEGADNGINYAFAHYTRKK
jgi:dihydrofolate reductase